MTSLLLNSIILLLIMSVLEVFSEVLITLKCDETFKKDLKKVQKRVDNQKFKGYN